MSLRKNAVHALSMLVPACLIAMSGVVHADDTEIYLGEPNVSESAKPNILFIIDTSTSMNEVVTTYVPSHTYNGPYRTDRIYWREGAGTPPRSNTNQYIGASYMKCKSALDEIAERGISTLHKVKQWNSNSGYRRWVALAARKSNEDVECQTDAGKWGDGTDTTKPYAYDSSNNTTKWTSNSKNQTSWSSIKSYTFYSGNYLNYLDPADDAGAPGNEGRRLDIVRNAAINLANTLNDVRLGLMRFSSNKPISGGGGGVFCNNDVAEGGMVTFPVTDIDEARDDIIAALQSYNASGCTPLAETLYEATQYFRGGDVVFGVNSRTTPNAGGEFPSVPGSRNPNDSSKYLSPIVSACQKNFIIYLTDGDPTADTSAVNAIESLPDFKTLVGNQCDGSGDGKCLDDLAEYLRKADLAPGIPGVQTATVYPIGFGSGVTSTGAALLQATADRSGGEFFTAADAGSLESVLETIVTRIIEENTNFTSPTIAINSFNRTQNLDQLYIGVFRPSDTYHWPGNLKKYRIERDGTIVGPNGSGGTQPVVNPSTGFFTDQARDYWSNVVDGQDVARGGAASRLPPPAERNLYSNLSGSSLTSEANRISVDNDNITPQMLGLDEGDTVGRETVINWALGDEDGDLTTSEDTRYAMGDPLHSRPVTIIYGGTPENRDVNDAIVLVATNDGYLHAIDASSGKELWAFIPQDLLHRLSALRTNNLIAEKQYGLDGNLRVYVKDVNADGVIDEDEDKVYVFFGMGRGGSNYYALDITEKDSPKMLWSLGPTELPGIAQTWSTPSVARVKVGDGTGQNADHLVLIFGGGYNPAQDNAGYIVDNIGNRIFMVDAVDGDLLWSAGPSGTNLNLAAMTNSFAAEILVLDLNNDGYDDRMYAADMGGRVWRFDVFSGSSANDLVKGGVFANLGAANGADHAGQAQHARRFYNPPDVALLRAGNTRFFNVAIGSGWRGHPLDENIRDRFYSLRDMQPFTKLTDYSSYTAITESNLANVTDEANNPVIEPDQRGWLIELRESSNWIGEKVLSESRTFNGDIFFTTFLPTNDAELDENACFSRRGANRLYIVKALDGRPSDVLVGEDELPGEGDEEGDPDETPPLSARDRSIDLPQGGIAPEVVFFFPGLNPDDGGNGNGDDEGNGDGGDNGGNGPAECLDGGCPPVICKIGLADCPDLHNLPPRKTFWREKDAD